MPTTSAGIAVLIGALIATSGVALAAAPTQADFDACNQMAQSKLSSPSASPQAGAQTHAKSSPETTQAAPSPDTADKARVEVQADQLRGIAEASKDDPGYQRAYRDCLKSRGF
jgi:hypothetical protein